jgi:type IV pilus assembly protein PilP
MKMLKLKNIYTKFIFCFAFLLSVTVVSPVQAKTGETEEKIQDEAPSLQKSANAEKERKYIYDPTGKTDPFKSFIVVQEEKKEEAKEEPRTYLETLELSQLSISVIIIGKNDRWAMVKDSKGDGHVIKEGTPIGINRGVVYKIKPGEVVIREEFKDYKGEKKFRDVTKTAPSEN